MLTISFAPLVPDWALLAFAAGVVLLAVLAVISRGGGGVLRGLGLSIVLLALTNPSLVQEERERVKDIVAVVVDRSTSQTLGERPGMTSEVREQLERRFAGMPDVEARFVEAGDGEGDDGTRLFGALGRALADVPPDRLAGVVMVTDGVVHDIPASGSELGFKAPLHALVTGRPNERDRRIALIEAPRFGIVGKDQTIRAEVAERGGTGSAEVTVRRDGQTVLRQQVRTGIPFSLSVRVEHGGPNVVEIEAESLPGELTEINNRAVVTIEGIREKLRVLLVSGEPHPGERTWRNLLKSDANVDLVHFTILRPPEKQDGTPINELSLIAFPTRELFQQKIKEFDLIIFDRYANQSVLPSTYFDNIVRYVREGGAVMVAAGPDYASQTSIWRTPLEQILPAEPSGRTVEMPFHAQLSDAGKRHPVTRGLVGADTSPPHWSRWFRLVDTRAANGTTIMEGPDKKPVLVLSREGEGRVGLLLSDHIWLWARGYEGGGPHLDLMRRLSHWLMKQPDLEEEALRLIVRGRDLLIERQTMVDNVGEVTLTLPSGGTRKVTLQAGEPGLWRGSVRATELGLWRATDGKLNALVNVGPPNPREFAEVTSTTEVLGPFAAATGGDARRLTDASGNVALPRIVAMRSSETYRGDDWLGLKMRDASVVRGIGVLPMFAGLLGLLLLVGALAATWAREGR